MLILTRCIGETLIIGTEITVTVLDIKDRDQRVKLGVNAPPDVPVRREEMVERMNLAV